MTTPLIIFFIFSAIILLFSALAVFDRKILRAAVYLLFVLIAMAVLFYMMNFQFLAAVQLILYAGGIVVLIIFSILLTSQINGKLERPKSLHLLAGLVTAVVGIAFSAMAIMQFSFIPSTETAIIPDMRIIGLHLLGTGEQGYALPFEVISILLLAALVGTIFIAKKSQP